MAGAMQLSTVCRRCKEAVAFMPSLSDRVWAHYEHDGPMPRLDSKLLLSWARHMTAMEYELDRTWSWPGILELTSAATNVSVVKMDCGNSLLTTAYADHLLARLPSVTELSIWGYYLPSTFSSNLTELRFLVGMPGDYGMRPVAYEDIQADAMLWRLGRLPQLQRLAIKCYADVAVTLTCPVNVHRLSRLFLRFYCTGDARVDLAWVHRQPTNCLEMYIFLNFQTEVQHTSFLQHLEGLRIHRLNAVMGSPFTLRCQAAWRSSACIVDILHLESGCNEAFDPLAILPHGCAKVIIDGRRGYGPVHVMWSALTQRPASFNIIMSNDWRLETSDLHLLGDCDLSRVQRCPAAMAAGGVLQRHSAGPARRGSAPGRCVFAAERCGACCWLDC